VYFVRERASEQRDREWGESAKMGPVIAPTATPEELHAFLTEVRATAYFSALKTAQLIDKWLETHPLPLEEPAEEIADEPAVAAA
jgi:hypothetical protein